MEESHTSDLRLAGSIPAASPLRDISLSLTTRPAQVYVLQERSGCRMRHLSWQASSKATTLSDFLAWAGAVAGSPLPGLLPPTEYRQSHRASSTSTTRGPSRATLLLPRPDLSPAVPPMGERRCNSREAASRPTWCCTWSAAATFSSWASGPASTAEKPLECHPGRHSRKHRSTAPVSSARQHNPSLVQSWM